MAEKKQPTQPTQPKKGKPTEIPIPTRDQVLRDLSKTAQTEKPRSKD